MVEDGIPFYGDGTYYIVGSGSYLEGLKPYFYPRSRVPLTFFTHGLPLTVLSKLLGPEWGVKAFIVLASSLSGILAYKALIILFRDFIRLKRAVLLGSMTGAIFYMIVFSSGIYAGGTTPVFVYASFPLSVVYFLKYTETGQLFYLIALALLSLIGNAQPFWIYLLVVSTFSYLITVALLRRENAWKTLKRILITYVVIVFVNAYWLLPSLVGYLGGGNGFFSHYRSEKLITEQSLRLLSHWTILDILMAGEHEYYFFWRHPQNYGPFNAIIPVVAATVILWLYRNRYILFIALVFLLGVFLAKGIHPPSGWLYYSIARSLPYGFGAILRNPTKFIPLVNFAYAVFIGLFVSRIEDKFSSLVRHRKGNRYTFIKNVAVIMTITAILAPVAYGTLLDFKAYTWPRFKPVKIPYIYYEINRYLLNKNDTFNVMWIPSGGAYIWKPYVITGFPDLFSSKPAVSFTKIYPEILYSTTRLGMILRILGVKYVIYHGDSISYPTEKIFKALLKQIDLKSTYNFNYTYVPKDNSKVPLPRDNEELKFSGSPFQLIRPKYIFRNNKTILIIKYTIPKKIIEKGFKGKFSAGFNIALAIYEAGYASLDKRIAWTTTFKQVMVNETSGYAYFKVNIPYTYPGTAVDIYAWFYDGRFKQLTPKYFIGRLAVKPKEVKVPFVIFRNLDYAGSIYVADLVIAYGVYMKDLLQVGFFNTRPWAVVFAGPGVPQNILRSAKLVIYNGGKPPNWLASNLKYAGFIYIWPLDKLDSRNGSMDRGSHGVDCCDYRREQSEMPITSCYVVRLMNSSLVLKAYVPEKEVYTVYLRAKGVLIVNGHRVVCAGFGIPCLVNLTLNKGVNEINVFSVGEALVKEIALLNRKALARIFSVSNGQHTYIVDYKEINPARWVVTVNASKPFVLVFTESYDRLWRAYVSGKELAPVQLYGLVNGFIINNTGVVHIELYYTFQTYYEIGVLISLVTFVMILALTIRGRQTHTSA